MNKTLLTALFLLIATAGFANHLKGGFFTYQYLGPGQSDPTRLRYSITLTVYMECNATMQQINDPINFTIFDAGSGQQVQNLSVNITDQYNLSKTADEQCITGDQRGCYYKIIIYHLSSVELPANTGGYTVSYQRCCRIGGIVNIGSSNTIGNTYSINIPGSAAGEKAFENNSATFPVNDTAVICSGSYFTYPIAASDADGHTLSYEFCNAWVGGNQQNPAPATAETPPYNTVPYLSGFSGSNPLGPDVTINAETGLISGTAPNVPGEYVITVCVTEKKDGKVIATSRKELHIEVGNCTPVKPTLDPEYISCDDNTVTFENKKPSSEIKTYFWDFGIPDSDDDTSSQAMPTFTYRDTGVYTIKAVVNRGLTCPDSTFARVKIFPGFEPNFTYSACDNNPTHFIDSTYTAYGVVNLWRWDFGDKNSVLDTSRLQNPAYTYTDGGKKTVQLIAGNSKGCIDTVTKDVTIIYKPFAGRDTAVVVGQQLQFEASGGTYYHWTPSTSLNNPDIYNPVGVYDGSFDSIRYTVFVSNEIGCTDSASVSVRIFKTDPQVFVPTAFTPDGDGNNDIFRPIPVGMTTVEYFRVFNRWGQLVYSANANNQGWDGKIKGQEQATGTYVWLVKGTDFTGKVFFAKGTVILIR